MTLHDFTNLIWSFYILIAAGVPYHTIPLSWSCFIKASVGCPRPASFDCVVSWSTSCRILQMSVEQLNTWHRESAEAVRKAVPQSFTSGLTMVTMMNKIDTVSLCFNIHLNHHESVELCWTMLRCWSVLVEVLEDECGLRGLRMDCASPQHLQCTESSEYH